MYGLPGLFKRKERCPLQQFLLAMLDQVFKSGFLDPSKIEADYPNTLTDSEKEWLVSNQKVLQIAALHVLLSSKVRQHKLAVDFGNYANLFASTLGESYGQYALQSGMSEEMAAKNLRIITERVFEYELAVRNSSKLVRSVNECGTLEMHFAFEFLSDANVSGERSKELHRIAFDVAYRTVELWYTVFSGAYDALKIVA